MITLLTSKIIKRKLYFPMNSLLIFPITALLIPKIIKQASLFEIIFGFD